MQNVLITGVAGFIGFHLANKLQGRYLVHGIDFFDPENNSIQAQRLEQLNSSVKYYHSDIRSYNELLNIVNEIKPEFIIHLAACTGIANSSLQPQLYFDTNVKGFQNVLEVCRELKINKLYYASSSSVYNESKNVFKEENVGDKQLSYYGTTKRMNEKLAEEYSIQYGISCIGMRFFTVYGSWVRQDMAAWKFMNALISDQPLVLFNDGNVSRDFTHVSDITESISRLIDAYKLTDSNSHDIFNIGNGIPVSVKEYLTAIAENLGAKPTIIFKLLPENELPFTHADTSKLYYKTGYKPLCSLKVGVKEMTDWFLTYKQVHR